MNVYDFDKTIYHGDSTAHFCFFTLRRHPSTLRYLPKLIAAYVRFYWLHKGTKTNFKEKMYSFLNAIDTKKEVELFWHSHLKNLKRFYLHQKRRDDVIVSASPEFLLKPLEDRLNIRVIASLVSPETGETLSENCYYEEKVARFREIYPNEQIDEFYSDSYSDEPLALQSRKAFIVKGETPIPWDFTKHKKKLYL